MLTQVVLWELLENGHVSYDPAGALAAFSSLAMATEQSMGRWTAVFLKISLMCCQ